ncbi:MAG: hypothetical protein HOW73_32505 [Polyangiaceae bacterium]|nr:hypothetical protein [Polyangiaceae bacterium]
MKLLGLETIDVAGVASRVYSFAKAPEEAHERVLVTGGPGAGKTRLLETIIAAREVLVTGQRSMSQDSFIQPEHDTSKVILSWQLTAEEQATIGAPRPAVTTEIIFCREEDDPEEVRMSFLLERYAHNDETPKFEYFSERRRLDVGGGEASLDEEEQRYLRTDPSPRKFSWLPIFIDRLQDEPRQAARFASSIERFSPSCSYDTKRHMFTSRGRVLRSLHELSASEADAVIFSATAALVGLSNSIVLVDRPELHGIDPARALSGLSGLGVDNQLILATSSRTFAAGFDGAIVDLDRDAASNRGQG